MSKKVVILYRVIQHWRVPIFEKLAERDGLNLEVWFGNDFNGSKVISSKEHFEFKNRKLISIGIKLKSSNGYIYMPFSLFLLFKLFWYKPDVVITEGASNLINSFQGFLYCKLTNKKIIWWSLGKIQNRKYDSKRAKIDFLIRFMERKSDAILTYSSVGYNYYREIGVEKKKIFKAVNVVDTSSIIKSNFLKNNLINKSVLHSEYRFINLFVGALTKEKSIDVLLKSQKKIEEKYNDCALIIVGDGEYRIVLENLASELKLKNVFFEGNIVVDKHEYFSMADLFTLPGLGGLAISEAMCYGLPIICSIGDGCEVDLVDLNNGFRDIELNEDKLFEYIEYFILNPKEKERMGKNSFEKIQKKFNIENYINQIINAINS
jgi:glycosyltransferase involved in cell wall biosynthesis